MFSKHKTNRENNVNKRYKEDWVMLGMPRKALLFIAFLIGLLVISTIVFAGTTGKIKGVVVDKESGEPIPGASVMILGTNQGAMTDPDGKYLITLVPPGTYVLKITSVSYSPMEVEQVQVKTDFSAEQNVEMEKGTIDLDKVIRVVGTKDILDIRQTSTEHIISKDEITTMPVQNVDQLLKQTAGVVTTNEGEIIIRGGRVGEVAYIVDGVTIGDPLGGYGPMNLGLSLTSGSIQEISIIKDGFDPEYGNALSGIIKITTQTGSAENTNATLEYITDDFGNSTLNEYSRNSDRLAFTLSGPDPILRSRILPALGLNFLEDREVTYFFYAEMNKSGTAWNYDKYSTPVAQKNYDKFNLFGISIPERQSDDYSINANILAKPMSNLKTILSYKSSVIRYTYFDWQYRYTPNTAEARETKWQSYSLELTHQLSKNMHYYVKGSYYNREVWSRPGDPDNPGKGLDPDEFPPYSTFERYDDLNDNGVYDAPEPLVNLFPDTTLYGRDMSGPQYTFGNYPYYFDNQAGLPQQADFRFNSGSHGQYTEGEPFVDLNGNGQWDRGDYLYDTNGNGKYDYDRRDVVDEHEPEPYEDGDVSLGEPFTDVNGNGLYNAGIDVFIMSAGADNQDLDRNSRYTYPAYHYQLQNPPPWDNWVPGIPYIDRNGNGLYDLPNQQYDPGEKFIDVNGNGKYDYGGSSNFLNVGTYEDETVWHFHSYEHYTVETRVYRQLGNHEIKTGVELKKEYLVKQDIRSLEQPYTGRPDGGPYPSVGELRDFYNYEPLSGSFYIRDNLEYGSMIASLGFRYDYFIQTSGLEEVAKNDDLGSGIIYGDRTRLSPRIGFSYPISDKAKIHFNYGHFYQLPSYTYMYDRNTTAAAANDVVGNYNLDYEKTIQYSFGVKYAMSEDYSIDVSGYFKDEFDKINSALVRLGGGALRIQQYQNRDYGRSRGFEVNVEKRGGRLINGTINYTYAFAYGKQSQARTDYFSEFYLNRESLSEKPLDDDIRHQFNCGIQLVIPETMKPRLFGIRIPSGWTFGVQGKLQTGKPFTPDKSYPNMSVEEGVQTIDENSLRMPSILNFDIRFEKYFKMVSLNWRFILWIDNVLNNRNAAGVYTATGRADTSQNASGVITGGSDYDRDPFNWQYGRQIKVGLQVSL
ncbi:MAG: TonB-dependent receptor [Candidatus Zixiibacteriota bacterium]|nr:MAG: TonB-dependent receptor [candidate division Zixibacteria bacterium]